MAQQKNSTPKPPVPNPQAQKLPTPNPPASKPRPTWLNVMISILIKLIVPVLCVLALIAGLIIGYVYLGKQHMADVWRIDTWRHVIDLIFAN